ncbi:MAG: hypothetical protein M3253_01555 [Chloroflexota bacterium]|nr:hypothetical protein [Chloroflexota bacterium]
MRRLRHILAALSVASLAIVAGCAGVVTEIPDWRTQPDVPYPFTTPIPLLTPTSLDGVYERQPTDTYEGKWAGCTRCPPYFVDRGRSLLTLDRGRWQNLHRQPRQLTNGHFTLDDNRIVFFNDPICPTDRGEYTFSLEGGALRLEVLDDPCAFGERRRDLTDKPWQRQAEGQADGS